MDSYNHNIGESISPEKIEIYVKDVYKKICNKYCILNGVTLEILKGQIFALLGPSGCGKTTLLRCILDVAEFDSGYIKIHSNTRKDIGYMPQELALQKGITIEETFNFYGTISGLNKKMIRKRSWQLVELLDLPSTDTILNALSLGQQRRVSLGVALIHDPQVIILDEPTVGLDPLLSYRIWKHLIYLSEVREKSIIITTHYVEEAKQAHMIGLMRSGRVIKQESPEVLMINYACSNLENVFLLLAKEQDKNKIEIDFHEKVSGANKHFKASHLTTEPCWNYQRFKAQIMKNITWQKRNLGILVFLILLPGILSYLCNEVLRSEVDHIPVGVILEDKSKELLKICSQEFNESSREFSYNEKSVNLRITENSFICGMEKWSCQSSSFSCLFLYVLPIGVLNVIIYSNMDEAKRSLTEGHINALLYFNGNFSKTVRQRMDEGLEASNFIIDSGSLSVWMDMTNPWIGGKIKTTLIQSSLKFVHEIANRCDMVSHDLSYPIKMENPVYGSLNEAFINNALPGLLCLFCFYLPMMFTQSSVLMEKNSGQIERSLASGLSLLEILLAHMVMQGMLCLVQNAVMMSVCYIVYSSPQQGSWTLIFLIITLIEFLGTSYGLLLSVVFNSERLSTYAAVGTMVCLLGVLGVIWPYEGMHLVIRKTLWAAPVVPALQAYRAVALKGWTLTYSTVAFGIIQTTLLTAFFFLSVYFIIKLKKIVC